MRPGTLLLTMTTRRLIAVAIVLALAAPFALFAGDAPQNPRAAALILDYGRGVEKHYTSLPCPAGTTVMDLLESARDLPAPLGLTLDAVGSGERAFVRAIDGLRNEGGGRNARNWIFSVNSVQAQRGAGVTVASAGDVVRWRFGPYNMDQD